MNISKSELEIEKLKAELESKSAKMTFNNPDLEQQLQETINTELAGIDRWWIIFGVMIFALWGVVDYYFFNEVYLQLWAVRYSFVFPALIVTAKDCVPSMIALISSLSVISFG